MDKDMDKEEEQEEEKEILNNPNAREEKNCNRLSYAVLPWDTPAFREAWQRWKGYKQEVFKFQYKGEYSEQAALIELSKLADGREDVAIASILHSIGNQWKGIHKPKDDSNGKPTSTGKPATGNGVDTRRAFSKIDSLFGSD